MKFNYTVEELNEKTLLAHFEGRIFDRIEADEAISKLDAMMGSGKTNLIISLEGMDYMNSSGLSVLLTLLNLNRERYGKMVLCNVPEKIKLLINTSKLESILVVYENQADAIKLFES